MSEPNLEELQSQLKDALASIKKLEAKNTEILEENKKHKTAAQLAQEAADEAQAERDRAANDVGAVEKRLADKHAREMKKLQDELSDRDSKLTTLLVDNTIATNLNKHNVLPQFAKAVTAMLKTEARIENGEAMIGDMPLTDHIASFLGGDEGRAFVAAPANGGAGAIGGRAQNVTSGLPERWNFTAFTQMKADNPEAAKAYAAKHNRPFA